MKNQIFFFNTLPSWIIILMPIFLISGPFLSDLGVKNMTILSNTKTNAIGLEGFDLTIENWKKLS